MKGLDRVHTGYFARFTSVALVAAVLAALPAAAGAQSYLLLRNGGVLDGEVSLVDGRYRLVSRGAQVFLSPDQVDHVADSPGQLYEWRLRQMSGPDTAARLAFAEWCLGQQLWAQADEQLKQARASDPENPRIEIIQQRLVQAHRQATAPPKPMPADPQVRRQLAETARAAQQLRLVNELPPGTLEEFTRRVQPILVNNCTDGGCHRPGGGEKFQLNRNWIHGTADRRSTFANLASVLAAIEREDPDASPLLRAAAEAHAGKPMGLLTGRQAGLQDRVTAWVHAVSQPRAPVAARGASGRYQPPTFAGLIGGGFQAVAPVGSAASYHQERQAAYAQAEPPKEGQPKRNSAVQPAGFVETYEPLETQPPRRGANLKPVPRDAVPTAPAPRGPMPRDEFDPALFNDAASE